MRVIVFTSTRFERKARQKTHWIIYIFVHSTFSEPVQVCHVSHRFSPSPSADACVWATRSIIMSGHVMKPHRWERAPVGTTVTASLLCLISGVGYTGSLHYEDANEFTQKHCYQLCDPLFVVRRRCFALCYGDGGSSDPKDLLSVDKQKRHTIATKTITT